MLYKITNNDRIRELSKNHRITGLAGLMIIRWRREITIIGIGGVETGSS